MSNDRAEMSEEGARFGGIGGTKRSGTLVALILGWVVVFGVLTAVLTSLKLGGAEDLKAEGGATPGLGEPAVREDYAE